MFGEEFRYAFEEMVQNMGDDIICYKNYGTPQQTNFEVRGLKNNHKGRPRDVMFQFSKDPGLVEGDVLQQKGAREVWRITHVKDDIISGVYVNFEAEVESMSAPTARPRSVSHVEVHGHVYGGLQVNSPNATQTNVVQAGISASLVELKELFNRSSLGELEKEEATLALSRLGELSTKPKSPELLKKVSEKIDYLKDIATDIGAMGTIAFPLLEKLHQFFIQ